MEGYPRAAVERMMKVQEVMLQAAAKVSGLQAEHIIGVTDRTMRRWRERNYQMGREGLVDRRRVRPSPRRVPMRVVEQVIGLHQERYQGFNVKHFHEKLVEEHQIVWSYSCVKALLQGAGLVRRAPGRGQHRKRRSRRPLPGMLCISMAASTPGFRTIATMIRSW